MPQARSAQNSQKKPAAKSAPAKPAAAAAKPAAKRPAAKPATTAKAAAAKAPAAKSAATKAPAAKAAAKRPAAKPAAKATAAKPAARKATTPKAGAAKPRPRVTIHVNTEGTQIEAIAERLRKLNERIIEVGREAGDSTLASYEKALKAIATGISHGPTKDEFDWISHLAASQAKFVREMTDSLAKAARERLK
jgi:hypothetical protein